MLDKKLKSKRGSIKLLTSNASQVEDTQPGLKRMTSVVKEEIKHKKEDQEKHDRAELDEQKRIAAEEAQPDDEI